MAQTNMQHQSFVIQIEVPSIKKYVFGSDRLNEIRGASARLDWLNREQMERTLHRHSGIGSVETIYANGGAAQFLVRECDECTAHTACRGVVRHIRQQTGGEVRAVYGIAPLPDDASYRNAVGLAYFRMRSQREFANGYRSISTMPTIMECESASHLPAAHEHLGPDGVQILSEASLQKVQQGQEARTGPLWDGWMDHLQSEEPWPERRRWHELRCKGLTDIGEQSSWRNYIAVVYADGNAMGKIVQVLDTPKTCRQFSTIVDGSIREACYSALGGITRAEVQLARQAIGRDGQLAPLPCDILLLGGDDLLVAVPADRALDFAMHVTGEFERLTREKIAALQDETARRFFRDQLEDKGLTISCGVTIAKGSNPFYLSLDVTEQLLKNAKRFDSQSAMVDPHDPTRIDFHLVAGANSNALKQVRTETFRVSTDAPRTLRPMTPFQLKLLRASVQELRQAGLPRSKLHELQDASLTQGSQSGRTPHPRYFRSLPAQHGTLGAARTLELREAIVSR